MPRRTATNTVSPVLNELQLYDVRIKAIEVQEPSQYGTSIKLIYAIDDEVTELWDFVNYIDGGGNAKLGKSPSGLVSRFRAFCNAVGGLPEQAEVAGFNDDNLTIDWPDGRTFRLAAGLPLRISGELRPRPNGEGSVYRVTKYRAALAEDAPQSANAA
jgi:hypothetical protein